MTLEAAQKEFIHSKVEYLFDELPAIEPLLRGEVTHIAKAMHAQDSNAYAIFGRLFQDPRLMSRVDDYGSLTLGEARECMVECIDKKITALADTLNITPESLGWNLAEIRKDIQSRPDHHTALISQASVATWQFWKVQEEQPVKSPAASEISPSVTTAREAPAPMPSTTATPQDIMLKGLHDAKLALKALQQALDNGPNLSTFPTSKVAGDYNIARLYPAAPNRHTTFSRQ